MRLRNTQSVKILKRLRKNLLVYFFCYEVEHDLIYYFVPLPRLTMSVREILGMKYNVLTVW